MLAIRMQRTGRSGHAMFRVVVQDSRQTPTSGRVVALLGNYDPHSKAAMLNKEQVATYLSNGAQPSTRVALLLKKEGIKLPDWVQIDTSKAGKLRNTEKLRKNRPAEPVKEEAPVEAPAEAEAAPETTDGTATEEAATEQAAEPQAEAAPASDEPASDEPAESAELVTEESAPADEVPAKEEPAAEAPEVSKDEPEIPGEK